MDQPTPNPYKGSGIRRFLLAFTYTYAGLCDSLKNEASFRQEFVLAVVMTPGLFFLDVSLTLRAVVFFSMMMVLVLELINSAIEACIDRVSFERHPLSKKAKDIGSAAVFIALVNSGAMWLVALWEHTQGLRQM